MTDCKRDPVSSSSNSHALPPVPSSPAPEALNREQRLEAALRLTRTRDEHTWNCKITDCQQCADLNEAVVDARCEALGDVSNKFPAIHPPAAPEALTHLIAQWRAHQAQAQAWAEDEEEKCDGANAHAHRKETRIWRTCADQLAATVALLWPTTETPPAPWRPMSSAPTDGTAIVVTDGDDVWTAGSRHPWGPNLAGWRPVSTPKP